MITHSHSAQGPQRRQVANTRRLQCSSRNRLGNLQGHHWQVWQEEKELQWGAPVELLCTTRESALATRFSTSPMKTT